MDGKVVAIYVAPQEGAPVEPRRAVRAVPGRGLEGDRYFTRSERKEAQDITIVATEDLAAAAAEHGLELGPGDHRRNVVVQGVDLRAALGGRLRLGEVEVEVVRLNQPCRYLQGLAGKPVLEALVDRAGIRGNILNEGTIAVGDTVAPA